MTELAFPKRLLPILPALSALAPLAAQARTAQSALIPENAAKMENAGETAVWIAIVQMISVQAAVLEIALTEIISAATLTITAHMKR